MYIQTFLTRTTCTGINLAKKHYFPITDQHECDHILLQCTEWDTTFRTKDVNANNNLV